MSVDLGKKIKVNETFVSLQGEGPFQGLPTSFIRFAGCNLSCQYCDTKYANMPGPDQYQELESLIVADWAKKNWPRHVCITGGEPLVQINALAELVTELLRAQYITQFDRFKSVSIETNGTIPLDELFNRLPEELLPNERMKIIMDVKTPSVFKGGMRRKMTRDNYERLNHRDSTKFVVATIEDLEWSLEEMMSYGLPNPIISPVIYENSTFCVGIKDFAEAVLSKKYPKVKFQIQLHKNIWRNKRGV